MVRMSFLGCQYAFDHERALSPAAIERVGVDIDELRKVTTEKKIEITNRTVALLRHANRSDVGIGLRPLLFALRGEIAMNEDHDVGILLDGAGLAQVGKLRHLVFLRASLALLYLAAELRKRDHGHFQLTRKPLQRARNLRNFLLAVLDLAARRAHELQVI